MRLKFIFTQEQPQNLGKFLQHHGISKQAIIACKHHEGMILVNQKRRHTSFVLQKGDVVYFLSVVEPENPYLKPNFGELEIVEETPHYLVINKPAGLLSIPSRYEDLDSVVNRLLGYFKTTEQSNIAPHVITRLDKKTSGLMVVAKSGLIHGMLAEMSKEVFVKKYQAIMHGNFPGNEKSGLITDPIMKMPNSVKHMVSPNGKAAKTGYKVLKEGPGYSLVELRLFTGRTHQIRVHLSSRGYPLFGDAMYGKKDIMKRQALNAYSLAFVDPVTLEHKSYQIKMPPDMEQLYARLEEDNEKRQED